MARGNSALRARLEAFAVATIPTRRWAEAVRRAVTELRGAGSSEAEAYGGEVLTKMAISHAVVFSMFVL